MGFFGGSSPGIQTQVVTDPYKTRISNVLSKYLAGQVGKGLPEYPRQLYEPFNPEAYSRYSDFLSLSPEKWWTKAVLEPSMRTYKEETLPLLKEAHAGQLSSSRFDTALVESAEDLATTLGESKYRAELEIPQAQFGMAEEYSKLRTSQFQLEFQDWMKSLPQMNPALSQALQFLAGPSGQDILAYQTPGEKGKGGLLGGGIGAVLGLVAASLIPGAQPLAVMAAAGGAAGYGLGSLFD